MSKTNISDSPIYKEIMKFKEKYAFDTSLTKSPRTKVLNSDKASLDTTCALEEFQRAHQAKIQQDTAGF